jgi:hypothetical protein
MNKNDGRSVKTCPNLDPIMNIIKNPTVLPTVADSNTLTNANTSLLIIEPMKTSNTSLGEGGKRFSISVKRNAAIIIPSKGRPCKNPTIDSSIVEHLF